uniref:Cadherin domain-containing protein n=1 Tax=Cyprinus carpio TaxID=7962 RepID=A0A8C2EV69_CYPCA
MVNLKTVIENPLEMHYVEIEISDINDHSPSFPEKDQRLQIYENTLPGADYQLQAAKDPDSGTNSIQSYKLSPNDPFEIRVRESDGDKLPFLVLKKAVDREITTTYKLLLTAVDGGNPPRSGTLNITINILDINDNRPVFSRETYSVTLSENSVIGSMVVRVNATDMDEGTNSDIEYSFATLNSKVHDVFELDQVTGEIPSDKGHPPMSNIPEDSKPGTVISLISVTDKDAGINGKVICQLNKNIPFELKPSFKDNMYSLVTKDRLDREMISQYDIIITASDLGQPSLTASTTINVQISDVNDNTPDFLINPLDLYLMENNKEQDLKIAENTLIGADVQLLAARDPDSGANSLRTYKLSHNEHFELEVRDGGEDNKIPILKLQRALDRERHSEHHLVLIALDGGNPPKSGIMNITINVIDINDNRPVFSKDVYSVTITENLPVGSLILQVNATDADLGQNGYIIYSFVSNLKKKVYDTFEIDKNTGELRVIGDVDYEDTEVYRADVTASDSAEPPMTTNCRVVIKVTDVNDNKPEIEVTSLSNLVPEDSKPGTVISLISLSDKDSGGNGKIVCSLSEGTPFELKPSFQENMYSLVTQKALDRELVAHYDILLTVTDLGQPPLSSVKTLSIEVSDVNDNKPEFPQNPLELFLVENNPPGASVFSISALDKDLNDNAVISYRIIRSDGTKNDLSPFLNVNSETGAIHALKSFDFETMKTGQFQVLATDSGTPSLSSNVTVNVFILDQNDNVPVILYPVSANGSAEGVEEIPRNVNAGHLVTKVRAYDADIGYNGWLLFSLQEVSDHSLFSLDRYTGQIRTLRSFTETDEAQHKLLILVKDNGNVSLSATATVIVKVVEPKEAFAASDVINTVKDEDENNVTFYLIITLGSVSVLFVISIIVLIVMQCSKSTDYSSKYLQDTNYDGTLCHSIQYRSGDKRYMLVGPRMSIGSTIVPGSNGNTLVIPDRRRRDSGEVRVCELS